MQGCRHDALVRTAVAWVTGGVVMSLLTSPLVSHLTAFVLIPAWVGYALLGVGVLVAVVIRLLHRQSRRAAAVAGVLVLSFGAALWFGGWQQLAHAGDAVAFRIRFARLQPRYAALVPALLQDTTVASGSQQVEGISYRADPGPPWRLAFRQPGGFLDNWEGVVYDPTGVVAQARGWRFDRGVQEFSAPPDVRHLFGGDIVECDHVSGPWYRCWFT
jgi:hypothetical protein